LEANGCVLLREGAKHSVYYNSAAQRTSTVPRLVTPSVRVNLWQKSGCPGDEIDYFIDHR
jgi:hypothetical protein